MSRYKTSNGRWTDPPALGPEAMAKIESLGKFAQTWVRCESGAVWYVDGLADEVILRCGADKARLPRGES